MHYYQFNIADWVLHTNHLTLEEEAVYRRLVDHYYDTENPISENYAHVIRRLRLSDYTKTVDTILNEFFTLAGGEWLHSRCEKEIKEYKKKAAVARKNGKKGGRPKKTKDLEITQPVNLANPEITQSKANQELLTNNHKPETKVKTKRFSPPTREELIQYCNEKQITVNVDKFLNHYESNGWKVGKNKMKSWTATLSNWGIRNAEDKSKPTHGKSLSGNEQRAENKRVSDDWLEARRLDRESREQDGDALEGTCKPL